MENIEISTSSKLYKFLTAKPEDHAIFGFIEYLPTPYVDHEWADNRLPTDTCSFRKAIIKHTFLTLCYISFITAVVSFVGTIILSLIIFPVYVYSGINISGPLPALGGAMYLAIFIIVLATILSYTITGIKYFFKTLFKKSKEVKKPALVTELYTSLKDKFCKKIIYVKG